MATDTQPRVRTVTFVSKGENLRLIRRPAQDSVNTAGQVYVARKELVYEFEPLGRKTLHEGEDTHADGPITDFKTEERETQDAITWMRRHPDFNVLFWEEGRAPGQPLPTPEKFMEAITTATILQSPKALRRLIELEESTHGRPSLLHAATNALERVEELREAYGDNAPEEQEFPLPEFNSLGEVMDPSVPQNMYDIGASQTQGLASPDDPGLRGGVPLHEYKNPSKE